MRLIWLPASGPPLLLLLLFIQSTVLVRAEAEKVEQSQEPKPFKATATKLFFGNRKPDFPTASSTAKPFTGGASSKPNLRPAAAPSPAADPSPSSSSVASGSVLLSRPGSSPSSPQLAKQEFIASIESQAIESILIPEPDLLEAAVEEEEEEEELLSEDDEAARREEAEATRRYAEARRLLANPAQARLADTLPAAAAAFTTTTSAPAVFATITTARSVAVAAAAATTEASVEEITRQYRPVKTAQRVRLLPIQSSRQPSPPSERPVVSASTEAPAATEEPFIWPTTYRPVEAVPTRLSPKQPASAGTGTPVAIVSPASPPIQVASNVAPIVQSSAGGGSFFGRSDPPNAVRVGGPPSAGIRASPPPAFERSGATATVRVDNVEVPRHSKMTKNLGLKLLQDSALAPPPPPAVRPSISSAPPLPVQDFFDAVPAEQDSLGKEAAIRVIEEVQATATTATTVGAAVPLVQGFRFKGDKANRVVFLSLADLGMEHAHARTLTIGGSVLIPVEGLVSSVENIPASLSSNSVSIEDSQSEEDSNLIGPLSSYGSRSIDAIHIQPREAADLEASAASTTAPPARPRGPNRFFAGAGLPAGALPVSPPGAAKATSLLPNRGENAAFVSLDNVDVPRFSKMVKNAGLELLDARRRSEGGLALTPPRPPGPATKRPGSSTATSSSRGRPDATPAVSSTPGESRDAATAPTSVVQGFRVVGDNTNRIIFLNLADLGLSPGTPSLRLGDQQLVAIEGLATAGNLADIPLESTRRPVSSPPRGGLPDRPSGQLLADQRTSILLSAPRAVRPAVPEPAPATTRFGGFRDAMDKMATTHLQQQQQGREISAARIEPQGIVSLSDLSSRDGQPIRSREPAPVNKGPFVFFEKVPSADELRTLERQSEASRRTEIPSDTRQVSLPSRDRQPLSQSRLVEPTPSGRVEFSRFPVTSADPLETLRQLTSGRQRTSADLPSRPPQQQVSEVRPSIVRSESSSRPVDLLPSSRIPVLPVQQQDSPPKVPGVEAVLQQEAELRRIQQQFRAQDLAEQRPRSDQPIRQEQRLLAPWELAEQRRIQEEQQSNQRTLSPWEIEEQRRIQEERQNSQRTLEPWEIAEQRRIQEEQQRNQRTLEPWEIAEQRRIQEEQQSNQRTLEPWEIAEQRRQQIEQARFQDQDFDYILTPDTNRVQQTSLPKVPGLETVLQQEAALRSLQQQAAHDTVVTSFIQSQPQPPPQGPLSVPGLEQHSRFVAELQAAQQSLRALS